MLSLGKQHGGAPSGAAKDESDGVFEGKDERTYLRHGPRVNYGERHDADEEEEEEEQEEDEEQEEYKPGSGDEEEDEDDGSDYEVNQF